MIHSQLKLAISTILESAMFAISRLRQCEGSPTAGNCDYGKPLKVTITHEDLDQLSRDLEMIYKCHGNAVQEVMHIRHQLIHGENSDENLPR